MEHNTYGNLFETEGSMPYTDVLNRDNPIQVIRATIKVIDVFLTCKVHVNTSN